MQFWCVLVGLLWVLVSSGGFRGVLVSSGAVLVGFLWVLVSCGGFWLVSVSSGAVLVPLGPSENVKIMRSLRCSHLLKACFKTS